MGVAAKLVGTTAQTLRLYEKHGLILPTRERRNRLYTENDIKWLRHGLAGVGRNDRPECPAGAHQHIRVGDQGNDRKVHPLQARGGPEEIAVVEGQHDRAAAAGVEDPRQAVLHAPVQAVRAFQEEGPLLLRNADAVFFRLVVARCLSHG